MKSHEDIHFYQIHKGILENRTLSSGAKLTFAIMANRVNITKKEYFSVSRKHVAFLLNKSDRQVSRFFDELVNAKIIRRQCVTDKFGLKHDYFRINWDEVKGLEEEELSPNANILEETPKPLNNARRHPKRSDAENISVESENLNDPLIYVEKPDEEPDWCGSPPDDLDYQDWFVVTPPPGWSDDIVDPGEPPDWCGGNTPSDEHQKPVSNIIKKTQVPNNLPRGWTYIRGCQCRSDSTIHKIKD